MPWSAGNLFAYFSSSFFEEEIPCRERSAREPKRWPEMSVTDQLTVNWSRGKASAGMKYKSGKQ